MNPYHNVNPRSVMAAAVRDRDGAIWPGSYHGDAIDRAIFMRAKPKDGQEFEEGFCTWENEFLTREEAFTRAVEIGQLPRDHEARDPSEPHTRDFGETLAIQ